MKIKNNKEIFIIKIDGNNFDFLDYSVNIIILLYIFRSYYNISKYFILKRNGWFFLIII